MKSNDHVVTAGPATVLVTSTLASCVLVTAQSTLSPGVGLNVAAVAAGDRAADEAIDVVLRDGVVDERVEPVPVDGR